MSIYDNVLPVVFSKETLKNHPEIVNYPLLDLRVGFAFTSEDKHRSLLTYDEFYKRELNFDTLRENAAKNAKKKVEINDFLGTFVYVTYEGGYFGAGVLACPKILEAIRETIGTDYYLLPSSVHEVIVIPNNGTFDVDAKTLLEMVKAVNGNIDVIDPRDVLTDAVYYYGADGLVLLND